ncbi:MAG: hypothetical protein KJT03_03805 [Verrucomicrobiae bacterium]|nr:hypothetical protein [Verrucomicrobiae bacterium]
MVGFGGVTYYGLFHLPFHFPTDRQLVSPSYAFGYNNCIAFVVIAGLLGLATLFSIWKPATFALSPLKFLPKKAIPGKRLPLWPFLVLIGVYAILTLVLYYYTTESNKVGLTWESRHFLHRIQLYGILKQRPYVDFQAEYGPALMYPPAWLHGLLAPAGMSRTAAYFLYHLILNVGGLWCLHYLLASIDAPARLRSIGLLILGLAAFAPYMGLNGVVLRYSCPFASILFGHRVLSSYSHNWRLRHWFGGLCLLLLLVAANVSLSSEAALAFCLSWLVYAGIAALGNHRVLTISIIGLGLAATGGRLFLPEAYYESLLRFSEGANNFPILPAPHILLYVATLFLIVPSLLTAAWQRATHHAPLQGALAALCVVMIPGALGRCDPSHVLFFSLGACLLLMVKLSQLSLLRFSIYTASYAIVFIGLAGLVLLTGFSGLNRVEVITHPQTALKNVLINIKQDIESRDLVYLSAFDKYDSIGIPLATWGGDRFAEDYLFERGAVSPEYYVGLIGVYTPSDIDRKLQDIANHDYILAPDWLFDWERNSLCDEHLSSLRYWFLCPINIDCLRTDLDPFLQTSQFIKSNFQKVEQIGSSYVCEKLGFNASPGGPQSGIHEADKAAER